KRSKLGRVLVAMRDKEDRVRFSGYSVANFKIFAFCLAAAFASHSRAGLAALGGGLAVALLSALASRKRLFWGMAVGAALGLAFAAGTLARLETLGDAAALRLAIIGEAFRLSAERPLLGVGSFDLAFQAMASAFPQGLVLSAHNVLAESLVERGWPATVVAVAALTLVLGQCARSIAAAGESRVRGAAAIGIATMVSLHGMVDFSVHIPTIAALVAFALGSGAAPSRQSALAPPEKVARGTRFQGARA
ncbi:MAG: O-antigen ligase family protein, partial [Alphaproteobacteria bacterium]|nr:O-antigen ligase family protein [Alphaproteobacteria bacterium]